MNKVISIIVSLLFVSTHLYAYDFEVDGILYQIYSSTEQKVDIVGYTNSKLSEEVVIPWSVKYRKAGQSKYITYTIRQIKQRAFADCSKIKTLTFNTYSASVFSGAFANCSNLIIINLNQQRGLIGESIFSGCSSINEVHIGETTSFSITQNTFDEEIYNNAILYVPEGCVETYRNTEGWNNFANITDGVPVTTYNLNISSIGNGSASYDGTTIRNENRSFSVIEGSSVPITFTPDANSRLKSVKLNNVDIISSVINNQYTINNISSNTSLEVEFETIPPTTFSLTITASGNGYVTYDSNTIRNKTSLFTVDEGTAITIMLTPDSGYRIKSVKMNNTEVTSSITNNSYTINNIASDTTLEVEFEAIPPTTYTLSITVFGNGSVSYNGTTIRSKTSSFTVNEGTSATISFTPDAGYRIKSVKVNSTDVTSSVTNNSFTISSISANTTLEVEFEVIPPTTYTLSIRSAGNGTATYNSTTIKNKTQSFTVNEGTSATISFTPDTGYRIKNVKLNNTDVTSNITNNSYTISNISANTTLEAEFEAIPPTTYSLYITVSGNGSVSYNGTTIRSRTSSFTVNEDTSATISFSPDNGYRIKSVKLNNIDVTESVTNGQYTISNISANTTLEVEFEAQSPIISFADANVKAICVSNWDTNGDGELSEDEAAAVTDLGEVFKQNTSITSFDELRYFTGLTRINDNAFRECGNLSSTIIPNGVKTIGACSFYGCNKLTSIVIPDGVKTIDGYAFMGCSSMASVDIPSSVTTIAYDVFNGCSSLTSIQIPNNVTRIDNGTFSGCSNLSSIYIHDGVESIGASAFMNCSSLRSVNIPKGVKIIGSGTFYGCSSLTSISIPNEVRIIGPRAFEGCTGLTSINIPSQVNTIGERSFYGCGALTSVTIDVKMPIAITEDVFSNRANANLTVPAGCKSSYKAADYWKEFKLIIENPIILFEDANVKALCVANWDTDGDGELSVNEATEVEDLGLVFQENTTISTFNELKFFTGLTCIGNSSFYGCSSLFSVELPHSVTSIGEAAFRNCYALNAITFSDNISSIEPLAFDATEWLSNQPNGLIYIGKVCYLYKGVIPENTNITLEEGTIGIAGLAFASQYNLISITIPSSVTNIGSCAFEGCMGLVSVNFSNGITNIGEQAFNGCSALNTIVVPNTVTTIGNRAFQGTSWYDNQPEGLVYAGKVAYSYKGTMPNDTKIILKDETLGIAGGTFSNCNTLSSIVIPSNVVSIGNHAFYGCTGLTSVTVKKEMPIELSPYVFTNKINANITLYVPAGSKAAYETADCWKDFKEILEILPTTYSLSIKVSGNGYVTYGSTTIRSKTNTFTVNEGTTAQVTFVPDNDFRIKSVKLNNVDVTTNVTNGQYTIYNINDNTTLEVEFEAIPVTTYSLSITATGNGYATYGSTTIRSKTSSFTVNEGTTAQVTFVPDNGYRVAKVLQNDVDVTASVVSNKYTINNISANTTLKVTFEEIPPTTYTLTITTSGNGSVTYENTILQNQTKDFTVTEGTYATLVFTPESGYRVASVKVNWATISPITSNQYTVNDITSNTTVVVTFEPIPVTAYSLSITASGNGSATFDNTTIRNKTQQFSVVEGTNVLVTFSPDNGHSVGSVKVNGADVTNEVAGNSYEIKNFSASIVLEVVFIENVNALTVDGVNYSVTSQTNKTVIVVGGNYGQLLTVPATFTQYGTTWTVTGIETDALKSNSELAAVMWDAEAPFTATVSNPNLLLYVKATEYANNTIKNVIVNGVASSITLYDASNGNNFYCPKAFLAHHISYTHHYGMITGINEAKGWETIALPFDVQTITHASKGKIVPFATWQETNSEKPFWLYEMTGTGFVKANSIKAQIPYIISMPNNSEYYSEWLLNGNVTFAASEVYVYVTDELQGITSNGKSFYPCFTNKSSTEGLYALNVNNDYAQNNSGTAEGSRFVLNMRQIHPFEAYMTTEYASRTFIPIFEESTPTDIPGIMLKGDTGSEKWHTLDGLLLQSKPTTKGVYILNGKKVVVK